MFGKKEEKSAGYTGWQKNRKIYCLSHLVFCHQDLGLAGGATLPCGQAGIKNHTHQGQSNSMCS
jgi:hypothetical protein